MSTAIDRLLESSDEGDPKRPRTNESASSAYQAPPRLTDKLAEMIETQNSFQRQMMQQQAQLMSLLQASQVQNQQLTAQQRPVEHPPAEDHDSALKDECISILSKANSKFLKKVKQYIKTNDLVTKRTKLHSDMKEDKERQVFPQGSRCAKSSTAETELDIVWSKCVEDDAQMTWSIPKGTSRRDALRHLQHLSLLYQQEIMLESAVDKQTTLKTATRRAAWEQTCEQALQEWKQSKDCSSIGLEPPPALNTIADTGSQWLKTKIDEMYGTVMNKAKEQYDKELEEAKRLENKKREEEEAAALQQPEELLTQFVDTRIARANRKEDDIADSETDNNDHLKTNLAKVLSNNKKQKNGYGDHGRSSTWSSQPKGGKSKGKGKGRKGKGKGKAQDMPTKGKSKKGGGKGSKNGGKHGDRAGKGHP
eukprot:TRINITY_DN44321_c0_g1_i3.p1 TRINITY_DN44321_c0_g1~~TRINITY_DN44321_c0_g1_i3.p1  ORF type:complete len:422 (-),score=91.21 TRINITY_DN44321_c0_g1_i3:990-2255(-)